MLQAEQYALWLAGTLLSEQPESKPSRALSKRLVPEMADNVAPWLGLQTKEEWRPGVLQLFLALLKLYPDISAKDALSKAKHPADTTPEAWQGWWDSMCQAFESAAWYRCTVDSYT